MRILFLEDDIHRVDEFKEKTGLPVVWAKTYNEFIAHLQTGRFDYLFLDHDLDLSGPNSGSGSDVARFLADNPGHVSGDTQVIIHSWNSYGVANMVNLLKHIDDMRLHVVHGAWWRATMINNITLAFMM